MIRGEQHQCVFTSAEPVQHFDQAADIGIEHIDHTDVGPDRFDLVDMRAKPQSRYVHDVGIAELGAVVLGPVFARWSLKALLALPTNVPDGSSRVKRTFYGADAYGAHERRAVGGFFAVLGNG